MSSQNSRRINEMRDPIIAAYMAEISKIPSVTPEEERHLLRQVKQGDNRALNALVSSHLKFVVAVCWNYRHRGLPLSDLINEGNLALFRAAEHFDPENPVRFMSYAVWWIRQSALDALARQAGSVSFPPDRMHKAIRTRRFEARLTQKLGRPPSPEELAPVTGDSGRSIANLRGVLEAMSSTRGYNPSYATALDGMPKEGSAAGAEADANLYLIRKTLKSILDRLNDKEQRILSLRFGLVHGVRFSLEEVGSILGITRERVRQLEERALSDLRKATRTFSF